MCCDRRTSSRTFAIHLPTVSNDSTTVCCDECDLCDWLKEIPFGAGIVHSFYLVYAHETRVIHPVPFALPSIAVFSLPSLYVCPVTVENVLGRVPLISCYQNGNSVNTIPHCFRGKIPREATICVYDIYTCLSDIEVSKLRYRFP